MPVNEGTQQRKTILVVDDNAEACRPLALLLRHLGYNGVCVNSGEDALAYLNTDSPSLIILDIMMPGIDGLEVLRAIRADEQMADIPVIMFSALSDPQLQQHVRSKGANDFWVKASLDFSELKRRIEPYLQ